MGISLVLVVTGWHGRPIGPLASQPLYDVHVPLYVPTSKLIYITKYFIYI